MLEKPVKFGVYLPKDLAKELDKCIKITGIDKKSKIVQEALRLFIIEHKWKAVGKASGIIGVIYNHEVKDVDKQLTDIQHDYLDIIVSTLHIHLSKEKCMLAIIVRGNTDRIKKLLSSIKNVKGVLLARPMLLETD